MSTFAGRLCEVFASIQGEGLLVGERQTFIRFAGCNLDCHYCDTPAARDPDPPVCRIEHPDHTREVPNPVAAASVVQACLEMRPRTVSITGGEPLVQADFLRELIRELRNEGFRSLLETNGTLPDELDTVVDDCDIIAMDIKMPTAAGAGELWDLHARFLRTAARARVFAKAVVTARTPLEEMQKAANVVAQVDRAIPLVIQPVHGSAHIDGSGLISLQDAALDVLDDVRVIPQCHRVLGLP